MPVYRFEKYLLSRAFSEVYRGIGNGFSKPVYLEALSAELELHGIPFVRNPELVLSYKTVSLNQLYIPDFLCFNKIIVMIKASRQLSSEVIQQFNNSVSMTSHAGYLVNFGAYPHLQCYFELALPPPDLSDSESENIDKPSSAVTLTPENNSPAKPSVPSAQAAPSEVPSSHISLKKQLRRQPSHSLARHADPPEKS